MQAVKKSNSMQTKTEVRNSFQLYLRESPYVDLGGMQTHTEVGTSLHLDVKSVYYKYPTLD